jgi:hypothetical protein
MRVAVLFIIFAARPVLIKSLLNKLNSPAEIGVVSNELFVPGIVLFHETLVVPHDLVLAHNSRAQISGAIKPLKPDSAISRGLAQHGHSRRQLPQLFCRVSLDAFQRPLRRTEVATPGLVPAHSFNLFLGRQTQRNQGRNHLNKGSLIKPKVIVNRHALQYIVFIIKFVKNKNLRFNIRDCILTNKNRIAGLGTAGLCWAAGSCHFMPPSP